MLPIHCHLRSNNRISILHSCNFVSRIFPTRQIPTHSDENSTCELMQPTIPGDGQASASQTVDECKERLLHRSIGLINSMVLYHHHDHGPYLKQSESYFLHESVPCRVLQQIPSSLVTMLRYAVVGRASLLARYHKSTEIEVRASTSQPNPSISLLRGHLL